MSFKKLITTATASVIALFIIACGDSESGAPVNTNPSEAVIDPGSSSSVIDTATTDTSTQVPPARTDTTPSAEIPPSAGAGLLVDDFEDDDFDALDSMDNDDIAKSLAEEIDESDSGDAPADTKDTSEEEDDLEDIADDSDDVQE